MQLNRDELYFTDALKKAQQDRSFLYSSVVRGTAQCHESACVNVCGRSEDLDVGGLRDGAWEGCSLSTGEGVWIPLLRKFSNFLCENKVFWCILTPFLSN